MKMNRIVILMGIVGLVYGTSSNAFYNVNADLTVPASYDITYRYRSVANGGNSIYEINKSNSTINRGFPGFVRTTDGAYYNYEWDSQTGHFDGTLSNILPAGLRIQMIFNRSNTSWFAGTSANAGYYFADDINTRIGSDANVGFATNKIYFKFDNQTNKNYQLYLDLSSNSSYTRIYILKNNNITSYIHSPLTSSLNSLFIPAYTTFEFLQNGSINFSQYFDAWYLKDLGESASYAQGYGQGYDDGENAVIASGGLQGIIEGVFDGIVAIFGIEIFNGITLGAIALFPLVITLFVFVMKIVKMGG